MRKDKLVKKLGALTICTAMIFSLGTGTNDTTVTKAASQSEDAKMAYIVLTESKNMVSNLSVKYEETENVNDNSAELAEKNNILALKMTDSDASRLDAKDEIKSVEKDAIVSASTITKFSHPKKVKKYKKNKKDSEWNIQMIHADKKKKKSKNKVKVAVLDSGVDYGNDIELSYSVSLVPGEEEMNPLFMDGTGHGNSVAGLIAACDNNEGITGVNPNAEIYSIRVLDDNNQAPISRVIEGIYMAIEQKVNIINMSFGISQYSEALHQAIKDASDEGILLIAAAGNTGENGVQYPAAFDEVMAVGSVDKNGDVVDSSAKGEEVELVAPGELVRTTGEFGNQIVTSGTSLAAPQVAGAASLLWEKKPSMNSNLVRYILDISANKYGSSYDYGYGLLDEEYAMSMLQKINNKQLNLHNENGNFIELSLKYRFINVYENTNCIKGSWVQEDHEAMVVSQNRYLKAGARFNDNKKDIYKKAKDTYYFGGMEKNPWWHGYYKVKSTGIGCNYVAAYIYLTSFANTKFKKPSAKVGNPGNCLTQDQIKAINDSIAKINWKIEIGTIKKDNTLISAKRAFVWGMALHTLSDAFAHSIFIDGKYLAHNGDTGKKSPPHDKSSVKWAGKERWEGANKAVKLAMQYYSDKNHPSGTYAEFSPMRDINYSNKKVRMANICEYIRQLNVPQIIVNTYKNCSHTVSVKKR